MGGPDPRLALRNREASKYRERGDKRGEPQPLGRPRRGRSAASGRVSVVKSESRASCPSLPRRRKAGGRGRRPVGLPGSHLKDRLEGGLCYRSPATSIGTSWITAPEAHRGLSC